MGRGVSVSPRALFTPGNSRYPLYRRLVGPQGRFGRCGKSRPHRPLSPARSQSLYQLSYPAHNILLCLFLKKINILTEIEYSVYWGVHSLDNPRNFCSFPDTSQVTAVSHTASSSKGIGDYFPVLENPGCEADHSLQLVPSLKMSGVVTYFPIHLSGLANGQLYFTFKHNGAVTTGTFIKMVFTAVDTWRFYDHTNK
jgi:hypothetical protein